MTSRVVRPVEPILEIIRDYQAMYGHGPDLRELARRMGLSAVSGAHRHVKNLRDAGLVELCPCGCRRVRSVVSDAN